jgi:signal transduction histidine kinase
MNLCINARDAMSEGGILRIRSRTTEVKEGSAEHQRIGRAGAFSVLEISDTGPGMQPQVMRRIFEPFFTTKSPREGTGLGLAVVYDIVRKHVGSIVVDSEPGRGTCFELYLPRCEQCNVLSTGDGKSHSASSLAVV